MPFLKDSDGDKMTFSNLLNAWFEKEKRDLPFRETKEAYNIWISEVMLQQTQVATVIDYYNRFVQAFPSVEALAQAEEEVVFKLWEGLGYYSRAKNLMKCAKIVDGVYGGVFPDSKEILLKLPGIGPYTAGAILSIAYNQPIPAVDGNVMRVMSRVFLIEEDIKQAKSRLVFEKAVDEAMGGDPSVFNQALMELGALICTPKNPRCDRCPVRPVCLAYESGRVNELPIATKKAAKVSKQMAMVIVKYKDQYLLTKRPTEGLMANLWSFPTVDLTETPTENQLKAIQNALFEDFGFEPEWLPKTATGKKHIFTHLVWHIELYFGEIKEMGQPIDYPITKWLAEKEWHGLAFPTAYKKQFAIIENYINHGEEDV